MAENDATPSQELLDGVGKPGEGQSEELLGTPTKQKKQSFLPLGDLIAMFTGKKGSSVKESAAGEKAPFNIKLCNQVLLAVVLAAAVYLVLDVFLFKFDESKFLSQVGTNEAVYPIFEGEGANRQEVDYYLKPLDQRNPFRSPSAIREEVEATQEFAKLNTQTNRMAELLGGLNLVGIAWADEPLAMIEDVESGRTYFARKGQIVRGVKIESITKEKLTVTYEGEEGYLV